MDIPLIFVFCTLPDEEAAATIGRALVGEKLAACVNIVPGLRSIYAWQGKLCDDQEVLCILKTRASLFEALRARIVALHPYELPEIVAVRASDIHVAYAQWMQENTLPST